MWSIYFILPLRLKRLSIFHFGYKTEFKILVGKPTKTHFTYFIFTSTTFILSEYESLQEFWHTWFYMKRVKSIERSTFDVIQHILKHGKQLSTSRFNICYIRNMTYDLIEFSFAYKSPICKSNINNLILICSCTDIFITWKI